MCVRTCVFVLFRRNNGRYYYMSMSISVLVSRFVLLTLLTETVQHLLYSACEAPGRERQGKKGGEGRPQILSPLFVCTKSIPPFVPFLFLPVPILSPSAHLPAQGRTVYVIVALDLPYDAPKMVWVLFPSLMWVCFRPARPLCISCVSSHRKRIFGGCEGGSRARGETGGELVYSMKGKDGREGYLTSDATSCFFVDDTACGGGRSVCWRA